jgi:hypothetical protein
MANSHWTLSLLCRIWSVSEPMACLTSCPTNARPTGPGPRIALARRGGGGSVSASPSGLAGRLAHGNQSGRCHVCNSSVCTKDMMGYKEQNCATRWKRCIRQELSIFVGKWPPFLRGRYRGTKCIPVCCATSIWHLDSTANDRSHWPRHQSHS